MIQMLEFHFYAPIVRTPCAVQPPQTVPHLFLLGFYNNVTAGMPSHVNTVLHTLRGTI